MGQMRHSSWFALLFVIAAGWGVAGLIALLLVSLVGWLGILIVGLIICLVAARAELDADSPAMSVTLLRRQYEQTFEETPEERFAKWAQRVERNRLLYIARTIGIATSLIGLNMFIVHQL
jgi:MFS family permease